MESPRLAFHRLYSRRSGCCLVNLNRRDAVSTLAFESRWAFHRKIGQPIQERSGESPEEIQHPIFGREPSIMKPTEHISVPALALRAAPGTLGCSLQPRRPVRNALWPSLALRACAALGHCSTGTGASVCICTPARDGRSSLDGPNATEVQFSSVDT